MGIAPLSLRPVNLCIQEQRLILFSKSGYHCISSYFVSIDLIIEEFCSHKSTWKWEQCSHIHLILLTVFLFLWQLLHSVLSSKINYDDLSVWLNSLLTSLEAKVALDESKGCSVVTKHSLSGLGRYMEDAYCTRLCWHSQAPEALAVREEAFWKLQQPIQAAQCRKSTCRAEAGKGNSLYTVCAWNSLEELCMSRGACYPSRKSHCVALAIFGHHRWRW